MLFMTARFKRPLENKREKEERRDKEIDRKSEAKWAHTGLSSNLFNEVVQ